MMGAWSGHLRGQNHETPEEYGQAYNDDKVSDAPITRLGRNFRAAVRLSDFVCGR